MNIDLIQYSQQPIAAEGLSGRLHNPKTNDGVDSYLFALSLRVREVTAQERIATAMEQANELLAEGRQQLVAGATVGEGPTQTALNAHMDKGGTHIDIQMDFTNPVKAATFFEDFMVHLKRMVDEAEEGGAAGA